MKTKLSSRSTGPFLLASCRGGALPAVMIVITVLTLVLGGFFAINITHGRVNHRSRLLNEARNAAQAVAETALAEADRRAQSYSTLGSDFLSSYTAPAADNTFLTDAGSISATSIGVKAGLLSPLSENVTLVPDDPMYKGDLLGGTTLKVRNGWIYSTATAIDPRNGTSIPFYFKQLIQVREQSWIDYGIFYNMDLEFHAGPAMDIYGPVHTNANAYVAAGGTLSFYNKVSASGRLFRKVKYLNAKSSSHDATVRAAKAVGSTAANLVNWPDTQDASVANWSSFAGTTWNYFVRDGSFLAANRPPPFNPKDLPSYIPENFATPPPAIELRNSAYAMIEPQLSTDNTHLKRGSKAIAIAGGGWDYGPEELKFSALAGFTIRLKTPLPDPVTEPDKTKWEIVYYQTPSTTFPVDKVNLPVRDAATGLPREYTIDPDHVDMDPRLKAQLLRTIRYVPYTDAGSNNPSLRAWEPNNTAGGIANLTNKARPRFSDATAVAVTGNLRDPDYAIYDRRQGFQRGGGGLAGLRGAFDCFIIDMEELNVLINMDESCWKKKDRNTPTGVPKLDPVSGSEMYFYRPDMHWSNIMYVETSLAAATAARMAAGGDKIRTAPVPTNAMKGTAVILTNARNLPQLDPGRFTPSKRTPGFTFATNAPVYIHGHYNADGDLGTGSSSAADAANTVLKDYDVSLQMASGFPGYTAEAATSRFRLPTFEEQPALIAADSVTVLSLNFDFSTSATAKGNAASTEISAAIMTGLVPTQPLTDQIWAGGVHNLIRYLENWGGTYRYRGSLIVLYESEVANRPYYEDQHAWYDPPTRDMGYHAFFVQGRIPPGIPIVRTLRRMNMERISAAEYNLPVPTLPKVQ